MSSRATVWTPPVLAALGLADAAYLAITHFRGELPPCGGYTGCGEVNSSAYSEIFGVPIAAFGAALYAVILLATLWRALVRQSPWWQSTLLIYSMVLSGTVFMAYLTAVEFFILHAVCYWCLGLAVITLALLVLVSRDVWNLSSDGGISQARRT